MKDTVQLHSYFLSSQERATVHDALRVAAETFGGHAQTLREYAGLPENTRHDLAVQFEAQAADCRTLMRRFE